jgi:Protein of unknown function (DUF3631)
LTRRTTCFATAARSSAPCSTAATAAAVPFCATSATSTSRASFRATPPVIGQPPDTLTDRSVAIDLKRRKRSETITPFRLNKTGHLDTLARKLARWTSDHGEQIGAAEPVAPDGVFNRDADNWAPLLAIADVAGGLWPERARTAALAACAAGDEAASLLELLLGDIHDIIAKLKEKNEALECVSSSLLIELLCDLDEPRPWPEYGKSGKPISNKLARLLKPASIIAERVTVRQLQDDGSMADVRLRGYRVASFTEAFERYLPLQGDLKASKCPKGDEQGTSATFQSGQKPPSGHFEKCKKFNNDGLLDTWTLSKGGKRPERVLSPCR